MASFDLVAVVLVGDRVDDGHRAGHGESSAGASCGRGQAAPRRHARGPSAGARRSPSAPSPCSGRCGCPSAPSCESRCRRRTPGSRARNAGATARRRRRCRCRHPPAASRTSERRIALGLGELLALQPPRRPETVRLGEPGGLRQRPGDGGGKQAHGAFLARIAGGCRGVCRTSASPRGVLDLRARPPYAKPSAGVAKPVDARDLKSLVCRRE